MNSNPLKDGALTENSAGLGTVTLKMVRERALEIAAINGHEAQAMTQSDWDQAKRELTGQTDADPLTETLEGAAESERWDPLPGSTGTKMAVAASDDEDAEGRSDNEKLVAEGIAGAEHDQMIKAVKI